MIGPGRTLSTFRDRPPARAYKIYADQKKKLRGELEQWMKDTNDPRFSNDDDRWDKFPYFGELKKAPEK